MEKKINIAELLKNCPEGMELDCTMYDDVTLVRVADNSDFYPIKIKIKCDFEKCLTKYGQHINIENAKCVIFPKGKTTWEGFIPPKPKFKCGDVIACDCSDGNSQLFIFKEYDDNGNTVCYLFLDKDGTLDIDEFAWITDRFATEEEKQKLFDAIKANGYKWNAETKTLEKLIRPKFKVGDIIADNSFGTICIFKGEGSIKGTVDFYCGINDYGEIFIKDIKDQDEHFGEIDDYDFATEEEKQKLFDVIKTNGYKWNAETKTLEKLIEPKFKVGDTITNGKISIKIGYIDNEYYYEISRNIANRLFIKNQDEWELISDKFPNKFNIKTLVPFESRVLVREGKTDVWQPAFYGFFNQHNKRFYTTSTTWLMCIPYNEDTKHLTGTSDECIDFYKNWQ